MRQADGFKLNQYYPGHCLTNTLHTITFQEVVLSLPSNNLETDHKENTSRGVYRIFPSGFTILIYYFIIPYILDDCSQVTQSAWQSGYAQNDRGIGVRFPARVRNILFITASRPALGPSQPPSQELPFFPPGVIRAWRWPLTVTVSRLKCVELDLYSIIRLHTCLIKYAYGHNLTLSLPDADFTPVFMWLTVSTLIAFLLISILRFDHLVWRLACYHTR
jgi:hypothetical protein